MGIDAEDAGHGPITTYANIVLNIYNRSTNGNSGILVIGAGKSSSDHVTHFWNEIGWSTGIPLTYVNTPGNILSVDFSTFRMLAIVSSSSMTPSGGLTNSENLALLERAADIRAFVDRGGGLLSFSQAGNNPAYGFLRDFGVFYFHFVDYRQIIPTSTGSYIGINTSLNVCCWHDQYLFFPSYFDVLAREANNGNPAAIGTLGVAGKPVIDKVESSLNIQGPFLQGVSLPNTITVQIGHWGGSPGRVVFDLNGQRRVVNADPNSNIVRTTYDMGTDLLYTRSGRWNELQITVYNAQGLASETRILRFYGVTLPPSLSGAYWEIGIGGNPRVSVSSSGVKYTFVLRWPTENINAARRVPAPFPLMGNTVWGHVSNQFVAEVQIQFTPLFYPYEGLYGQARIEAGPSIERKYNRMGSRPKHNVKVASFDWGVEGGIFGEFTFMPVFRLQQLGVIFDAGINFETTDMMPLLASAYPLLIPIVPLVDIYGRFRFQPNGSINFWDNNAERFTFSSSELTLSLSGALVCGIDRTWRRWVVAQVEGGARPFIHLQYPGSPENARYFGVDFLHQVGIDLYLRGYVRAKIWFMDMDINFSPLSGRFVYPDWGGYLGLPVWLEDFKSEWRSPDRSHLWGDYHRVTAGSQFFPQDGNRDVQEEQLIQNVFPSASPALIWKDERAVILYAYDDPNLPANQSTEIRALHQQGDGSWQDKALSQDTLLDSQPVIGQDSQGRLVAVWTRLKQGVAENEPPTSRLTKAEIAYSVYDEATGAWSAPVLLTADDRFDFNPQLVRGADGVLYLVWLKSPDNVFPTDLTRPRLPHTDIWLARWNGAAFVETRRAIARADTQEVALAVSRQGVPMLAWSRDADGNPDTQDLKLYFSYWDGANWTSPQQVWGNPLPQSSPALAIGANDTPVLYFVRSGLPHPQFENYLQEELLVTSFSGSGWRKPLPVTRADVLNELQVVSHSEGRVSAVWLASSQGVADLWTAIYDPSVGYWSNKVRLTQDELSLENQVAAAWDPAGSLSLVYVKQRLELQARQIQDQRGNWHTVQVAAPVASDLYLLSHRPRPDLAIREGDLTLEPSNPGAGQDVTIRVRVSNLRAMGARDVQVRFYDGDPEAGGTPIGAVQATPNPIVGGGFGTASLSWRVPTDGRARVLYVRVDPDNAIAETDETNNTASYPIAVIDLLANAPVVERYLPDGGVALQFGIANDSPVSPSGEVRWELRLNSVDGAILAQGATNTPPAGQTSQLTFTWRPEVSAGRYTLYLVVDPDNRFAESDEANNTARSEIALLPDLAVNPVQTTLRLTSGGQAVVDTTIQNLGWTESPATVVQVLDAPPGRGTVLASASVPELSRHTRVPVQMSFSLPSSVRQLWVVVNPDRAIPEARFDNNMVSLLTPLPSDINGDGCVDDADLLEVLFNFGNQSSPPSLTWLGTLGPGGDNIAYGTSADGSVVVGMADGRAFRWTASDGMQDLGTFGGNRSEATGVSADGSVVVGWAYDASGRQRAFRWTAATGMQDLGTLGGRSSAAWGVSADGSVVVGWANDASGRQRAFRWTAATGMQDLGTLGGRSSAAWGVSADGSVVVGWAQNAAGKYRAFRWTAATGLQDLGTLGSFPDSLAFGVSEDGSVVIGRVQDSTNSRAFRWTASDGMQDLGTFGGNRSGATGVSADGSVVVGWAQNAAGNYRAFRWTAATGLQDLGTLGGMDSRSFGRFRRRLGSGRLG
jgi:probable HAF family extracellular repeat protein